jgi:lipoprotein signal peptidase
MTQTHGRVKARATEGEAKRKERLGQRFTVLTLLAAVIAVDQAAKWWAWRHVSGVNINPGGDFLTGPTIGRWYAHPVTGALLDLMSFGLVSIAVVALVRRQRPAAVTVCGSLMVGGWASNLLDRLGMHYWTAPGSIRGAVDFISIGDGCWNLADLLIVGTTPLFLLATAQLAGRAVNRRTASRARPAIRNSLRARVPAVAAAGAALIMTVALGASHHGSLTKPAHTSTCCNSARRELRPAARDPARPYRLEAIAARAAVSSASATSARRLYKSSISGRRRGDAPGCLPPALVLRRADHHH